MAPTIKTDHGRTYQMAEWNGINESNFTPIGDLLLIKPDEHVEKIGSILMTDQHKDRAGGATQSGVVVEMGDGAFVWGADRARKFEGTKPKVGDRVIFGRYEGQNYTGDDGIVYRLLPDKCIAAIHTMKKGS